MKTLKPVKTLALALSIAGLASCASTGGTQPAAAPSNIPEWVLNPIIENGIADVQCQPMTASFSVVKTMTTAQARAELAKQIDLKVQAMDKTFQELTQTSDGPVQGGTFSSVSRQVTEQNLSGSRVIKIDPNVQLPPDNKANLCVMVALDPAQSKAMFEDLIQASKTKGLSPDNKEVLYQKFLMSKELKELDDLLGG